MKTSCLGQYGQRCRVNNELITLWVTTGVANSDLSTNRNCIWRWCTQNFPRKFSKNENVFERCIVFLLDHTKPENLIWIKVQSYCIIINNRILVYRFLFSNQKVGKSQIFKLVWSGDGWHCGWWPFKRLFEYTGWRKISWPFQKNP